MSISGSSLGSFKKTTCGKYSSIICLAFLWVGGEDDIPSATDGRDQVNFLVCKQFESGEPPRGEMDTVLGK
jgi:hypothetical protein